MIKFSVVIPAFNEENFICGAIESVLFQRDADIEIVVVDNQSTDRTVELAEEFGPEVAVYKFQNHGVIAASRNFGASKATGDFVIFLDADDLMLPRHLSSFVRILETKSGVNLLTSDEVWVGENGLRIVQLGVVGSPNTYEYMLANGNRFSTSALAIRRSVFFELGGFSTDPNLVTVEDFDFWLCLAKAGYVFERSKLPTTISRIRSNSNSANTAVHVRALKELYSRHLININGQKAPMSLYVKAYSCCLYAIANAWLRMHRPSKAALFFLLSFLLFPLRWKAGLQLIMSVAKSAVPNVLLRR